MDIYDVIVIGGGPAGLAAAASARRNGAEKVLLLERDDALGGILNQCIHDGFGLRRYGQQLTGPEYAARAVREAAEAGVEFRIGCMVTNMTGDKTVTVVCRDGMEKLSARALVLSTGCRERTRGTLSIPGPRPAGIYTAGVVQNLVNCKNIMPGRKAIILGSGDIGLIMARRLTLEGAQVLGVVEIMPEPSGLTRNVSQCVLDYDIPLYLAHTVSRIIGKKRLEAVEIAKVDRDRHIILGTECLVECDTLVLSVGLIPENEVAKDAGVVLDRATNSVLTDEYLQTNIPGVFSCGNSRKLVDFVDLVSKQAEAAGKNAVRYIRGEDMNPWTEPVQGQQHHGMPKPGAVICPICPNGCEVVLDANGKASGSRCERGMAFARQEKEDPLRMLTTTMRTVGGKLLPVRTDKAIAKKLVQSAVELCRKQVIPENCCAGDVVASDILRSGADILVCADA